MNWDDGPTRGHHRRVLVVEDDDGSRRSAVVHLVRAGFDVVEASDGATALGMLVQPGLRFEAVLLDLRLPDIPGREVAHLVPQIQPGLPVIVCSGTSRQRELPHAAWLQKPCDPARLVEVVSGLARLGDRRASSPAPTLS